MATQPRIDHIIIAAKDVKVAADNFYQVCPGLLCGVHGDIGSSEDLLLSTGIWLSCLRRRKARWVGHREPYHSPRRRLHRDCRCLRPKGCRHLRLGKVRDLAVDLTAFYWTWQGTSNKIIALQGSPTTLQTPPKGCHIHLRPSLCWHFVRPLNALSNPQNDECGTNEAIAAVWEACDV